MFEVSLQKKLHSAQGDMLLDIEIKEAWGKVINIFGPSGAGKTSILRMLAGLMSPDAGAVHVRGNVWYDSTQNIKLKPQVRRLGFIFQDYALFPNMSVKENLIYALDKGQSKSIVYELMELIELGPLQDRHPKTLSGGQQQRVALARSLVRMPDLLLLDEPLSALDQSMRKKLQAYILSLHKKYQLTTILVSHDLTEVFKMSDVVYKISEGKIVQSGTPADVFSVSHRDKKGSYVGTVLEIGRDERGDFLHVSTTEDVQTHYVDRNLLNSLTIGDSVLITEMSRITNIDKIKP